MQVIVASHYAPSYVGGIPSYQRQLATSLASAGIEVRLVAAEREHPILQAAATKLDWPLEIWRKPLGRFLAYQNIFRRMCSRTYLHGPMEFLLDAIVSKREIDVLVGNATSIHWVGTGWQPFGFVLHHSARRKKIQFSVMPAVHPNSWGDDRVDIRLYQKSDAVVCLSQFEKNHLAVAVDASRLFVCVLPPACQSDGNGVAFRKKYRVGDALLVLFLGRRDEGKGYPHLLKAWKSVIARHSKAVLLLAGPKGGEFLYLRDSLPSGSVIDLGVASEETKADAIAACDVFCLPSAHESFGLVYVEAWSYGKPVVCGTSPACRELIRDGETGLWSEADSDSIAKQLLRLLDSPNWASQVGAAGFILQQSRYCESAFIEQHIGVFKLDAV